MINVSLSNSDIIINMTSSSSKNAIFTQLQLSLSEFWLSYGATQLCSYDMPVGAGTYHPATVFGVLGKKPMSIFYIQPSRRPQDGRYGESANRLYQHHQFQVVLKPTPTHAQTLVYQSLEHIGISPAQHDIRFIENNWESPVLGANGVGWEVWCDGTEILQYTYFQRMGGQDLEITPIEYAYGLERLALILNRYDHIMNIPWSLHFSYGDIRKQQEYDHSVHTFQGISPNQIRGSINQSLENCHNLLNLNAVYAAYDTFLHAVHNFNLIHGYGALGVAERADLVLKLRTIANLCCKRFVENAT